MQTRFGQWHQRPGASLSLVLAVFMGQVAQAEPALVQRLDAARQTARQAEACVAAQPFYWEVGNGHEALAGGSEGERAPGRDSHMAIASASKWVYAAYVAERRHGQPSAQDWDFLNFTSGYTRFRVCRPGQTVADCQANLLNGRGRPDPATRSKFDYNGGHMQQHAMLMGLGAMGPDALADEVAQTLRPVLGRDWQWAYSQAQPAGGGVTTPGHYARFLQGTVSTQLQLGALLGQHKVCANPVTCPNEAVKTPIPQAETWHYGFGHWVEDDPKLGDGAYSSPGAFGFYPWISADKRFYGLVAREVRSGILSGDPDDKPAIGSVACGRAIRAAWLDGQARQ